MFLSKIDLLDKQLFHFLNSLHSPFGDAIMEFISRKWLHLPLAVLFVAYIFLTQTRKKALLFLFCGVIAVGLADITSARICKPLFQRVRPCHQEAGLAFEVHTVNGQCGGKYGFVSSHSANLFAAAVMISLMFRQKRAKILAFLGAASVAYSRIYLGVHYPADVFFGAILGICMGMLGAKLREYLENQPYFQEKES
jgi:undecaprenyl-diphosphatase